jgi:hypothetical protein
MLELENHGGGGANHNKPLKFSADTEIRSEKVVNPQ